MGCPQLGEIPLLGRSFAGDVGGFLSVALWEGLTPRTGARGHRPHCLGHGGRQRRDDGRRCGRSEPRDQRTGRANRGHAGTVGRLLEKLADVNCRYGSRA